MPFFLKGNFAPVQHEMTTHDLPIEGVLPVDLAGTYLRNGPNPRTGMARHWLVGDGMVHGISLGGGTARVYRNRYVGGDAPGPGPRDLRRGGNNTHVIEHGGRLLALSEARLPIEIDGEFDYVGPFDFGGAVDTAVTAHPKRCSRTGELHFFGYQFTAPYLTYYVADAAGQVIRRREVEVPGPSYMHDFALTARHALFFDTPVRMIADWGAGPPMPFQWDDSYVTRIAAVPRDGAPTRWFEIAPCVLAHTANAFEEDGTITIEGIRSPGLDRPPAQLHRWHLDLATGAVREERCGEHVVEFPRIDERRVGLRHRYTYTVELHMLDGVPVRSLLRRHDSVSGESRPCDFGPTQMPGECVLATGADPAEDAGWLLTLVYDAARDGSDLVVLDARDFGAPPVARVRLPHRVPFGFHGSWVPTV